MAVLAAAPLAVRSLEYWIVQYRRTWRGSVATTVLNPILFLAAMGLGLGSLVDRSAGTVDGVRYLVFLAPGLLAANAMQTCANESMFPVMAAIKWVRTYHAQLATPLGVLDVLVGHLLWIALRTTTVSAVFLVVMVAFGAADLALVLLALPAAVLVGMAFATPLVALAASVDQEMAFPTVLRFVVMPLFLFSGVFFPVSQLPAGLEQVAYATPLWHGVDLCRDLALGTGSVASALGHVAYLGALTAAGVAVAVRAYTRKLAV